METLICRPTLQQYEKEVMAILMEELPSIPTVICHLISTLTTPPLLLCTKQFGSATTPAALVYTLPPRVHPPSRSRLTESNSIDAVVYGLILRGYRVKEVIGWNNAACTVQLLFAPPDLLAIPASVQMTVAHRARCYLTPAHTPAGLAFLYPADWFPITDADLTGSRCAKSTLRLEPGEFLQSVTAVADFRRCMLKLLLTTSQQRSMILALPHDRIRLYGDLRTESLRGVQVDWHQQGMVEVPCELVGLHRLVEQRNGVINTLHIGATFIRRESADTDMRHASVTACLALWREAERVASPRINSHVDESDDEQLQVVVVHQPADVHVQPLTHDPKQELAAAAQALDLASQWSTSTSHVFK